MTDRSYTIDPACSPDTWYLWIGPNRLGIVSVDAASETIKQIEYRAFDPYSPQALRTLAKETFGQDGNIPAIIVSFRFDQWAWIPGHAGKSSDVLDKWIRPFFPERLGHTWVDDPKGPADSMAWVEVPTHLVDQLTGLSPNVTFRHAAGFHGAGNVQTGNSLELSRMGNRCWLSLQAGDRFLYGQPHIIEKPDDLLYVLGILFDKFDLRAADTRLSLVGEWEPDAEWLQALRKRFSQIEGRDSLLSSLRSDLPGHWFTPLADLLSCE